MKIARILLNERPTWAIVDLAGACMQPIAGEIADWGPAAAGGSAQITKSGPTVDLDGVRFLPPITASTTVVGLGMNYWSHLDKLGVESRPSSPIGFLKPRSAIIAHGDPVAYPAITDQLDFEVELVAVLAKPLRSSAGQLADAILGYTVGNDVSARDTVAPMGGLDLFSMKVLTGTSPVGPWITTRDEFGASQPDVSITLRVNGQVRQRDRTSNMMWNINDCLKYVVERMALEAGDIVFTGTTAGVGLEDGRFLKEGDVIEAEVEGVGVLRNVVGQKQPALG